jgi:hypothetical protein
MEQPQSTNPVDGHVIVGTSSSIWQDELHLNQATVQPCSKNPINATTDNNGINGNVVNPSIQATAQPGSKNPINATTDNRQ